MKEKLLYLVHRIPFPPNKGDKVRSYNILKALASEFELSLGCFVDDPEDWKYLGKIQGYTRQSLVRPLNKKLATVRSSLGLLTGEPLSVPYYRDSKMKSWVRERIERDGIRKVVVFSSPMFQFVEEFVSDLDVVVDFVDVDSDKWRQYAKSKRWPMSYVYRREAETLLSYERRIAVQSRTSSFVSAEEAGLFRRLCPECAGKIISVKNGVDFDFFDGSRDYPQVYPQEVIPLVFTGAMDYWANVDAAVWFAREILPRVRQQASAAQFFIVGANPTPEVLELGKLAGVTVTGKVEDIRPYIANARISVAPMRIARGVQNKVLEAMSLGREVVCTSAAAEGIELLDGEELLVADQPGAMAELILNTLAGQEQKSVSWQSISENYSWNGNISKLIACLGMPGADAGRVTG